MNHPWSVRLPQPLYDRLHAHLFPGDGDEHGAVIAVGITETARGVRLLGRELFLAEDGTDYVPGIHGYRALTAQFIAEKAGYCGEEKLGYLAVHNHGGRGHVGFSSIDLDSHERGYPALLDLTNGGPVGALVFAEDAIAGDIWLPGGERHAIDHTVIVGPYLRHLFPAPPVKSLVVDPVYDRHARLFGDLGQARLSELKVGIIGAGGGGSLLVQMLAHLGVGHLVVVDHDRVEPSNLPRIVGATRRDAGLFPLIGHSRRLRRLGERFARPKVAVAERVARRAQSDIRFEAIVGDVVDADTAALFRDTDAVFLATDTMQSRVVFNALAHQYLIPGFQVGAKVPVDPKTRRVDEVFSVSRPVFPYPGAGCLSCNGWIDRARAQQEALPKAEREAQRYVDDPDVHDPSVMTLNGIGTASAANDLMMMATGLFSDEVDLGHHLYDAQRRDLQIMGGVSQAGCRDCGLTEKSRLGRGDRGRLPCRPASTPPRPAAYKMFGKGN